MVYEPIANQVESETSNVPSISIVEGAVVVNEDYIDPDRKIAVQLMTNVRFGREEDEVMGVNFSREFCLASIVLNTTKPPETLTKMQVNSVSTLVCHCHHNHS